MSQPPPFALVGGRIKGFVPGTPNAWAGEGLTVTIKSFDGTRVAGTFEGMIPAGSGDATEPATVKGGKFSVDLDAGGA